MTIPLYLEEEVAILHSDKEVPITNDMMIAGIAGIAGVAGIAGRDSRDSRDSWDSWDRLQRNM